MSNWREHHLVDADGGPDHCVWYPDVAGHFIDPRVRVRILENPDLTVIMVHRAAMASSNPCWLILTAEGATICSSWHLGLDDAGMEGVQMAPDILGTVACAWLETRGEVIVDGRSRDDIIWQPWVK